MSLRFEPFALFDIIDIKDCLGFTEKVYSQLKLAEYFSREP